MPLPKLAEDLKGFLERYGPALARTSEKRLPPVVPICPPMPDLRTLELHRTSESGRGFRFYPSQRHVIAGAIAALNDKRRAWLVCACGTGKTSMSLAAAHLALQGRSRRFNGVRMPGSYRILVMCPAHMKRKWAREARWIVPDAEVREVRSLEDLAAVHTLCKTHTGPVIAVAGKDNLKLGYRLGVPAAAGRKVKTTKWDKDKSVAVHSHTEIAVCPRCFAQLRVSEDKDEPIQLAEYLARKRPLRCPACNEEASTGWQDKRPIADGPTKWDGSYQGAWVPPKAHLDRYIQRHMKGMFDLLIADEVHELAGAATCQGNAFGTLAANCRYTLALTGTLIGGKASDLHAPLWRMSPAMLREAGFDLRGFAGRESGALAANSGAFSQAFGVMEHKVIERGSAEGVRVGSVRTRGRGKSVTTEQRERAGINPALLRFLQGNALFLELDQLGTALPSLTRQLIPVRMEEPLRTAYQHMDEDFIAAIKDKGRKSQGRGSPCLPGMRIVLCDAYLDHPWDWQPITVPTYDKDGEKDGGEELITAPRNLGEFHQNAKDRALIDCIRQERSEHRKCAVYVMFTQRRDVRTKLSKMLAQAGLNVLALPDSVKATDREEWIETKGRSTDVLLVHPRRVMTGLDLIRFPTLIFYEVGYSTHVLRQAGARARRPNQTKPCKVVYLYYEDTVQESCVALMGEKERASLSLEGTFDPDGLRQMMNGGLDDDILSALTRRLGGGRINAVAAWKDSGAEIVPPIPSSPLTVGTTQLDLLVEHMAIMPAAPVTHSKPASFKQLSLF
jgi:hypothetical protein